MGQSCRGQRARRRRITRVSTRAWLLHSARRPKTSGRSRWARPAISRKWPRRPVRPPRVSRDRAAAADDRQRSAFHAAVLSAVFIQRRWRAAVYGRAGEGASAAGLAARETSCKRRASARIWATISTLSCGCWLRWIKSRTACAGAEGTARKNVPTALEDYFVSLESTALLEESWHFAIQEWCARFMSSARRRRKRTGDRQ